MDGGAPFFFISVFLSGLLSFFAPCILPLLPVYVARLSGTGNVALDEGKSGFKQKRIHGIYALLSAAVLSLSACTQGVGIPKDSSRDEMNKDNSMGDDKNQEMKKDGMEEGKDMGGKEPINQDTMENTMTPKTVELDFSLMDPKGNQVVLSGSAGKKIYIKFWATWCSICLSGLKELEEYSLQKAESEDTVVLTVVSPGTRGEMSSEDFKAWYEKQRYSFPVVLDEGGKVAREYSIRGYPTSVFIGTDGKIAKSQPGHVSNERIDEILKELQ